MPKFINDNGLVDETPCPGCSWPMSSCLCQYDEEIEMAEKIYTLREYAQATGQLLATVRQQAHRGTLPTQLVESPVGSYRIVTQAQVDAYHAQQADEADEADELPKYLDGLTVREVDLLEKKLLDRINKRQAAQ